MITNAIRRAVTQQAASTPMSVATIPNQCADGLLSVLSTSPRVLEASRPAQRASRTLRLSDPVRGDVSRLVASEQHADVGHRADANASADRPGDGSTHLRLHTAIDPG